MALLKHHDGSPGHREAMKLSFTSPSILLATAAGSWSGAAGAPPANPAANRREKNPIRDPCRTNTLPPLSIIQYTCIY
jgi:hypothetical protein